MSTHEVLSQTRTGDRYHLVVRVTDNGSTCPWSHWLTDEQNAAVLADPEAMSAVVAEVVASAVLWMEAAASLDSPECVEATEEERLTLAASVSREDVAEAVARLRGDEAGRAAKGVEKR